jgi:rhamnulose-1-phosphate aldolase
MSVTVPFPEWDEILAMIGEAGQRLSEIGACEGAAGNISVFLGWPVEPRRRFPLAEPIELPAAAPELAGGTFIVTGSGRRLREVLHDPAANLGVIVVDADGRSGRLFTSPRRLFAHPTSEFNSHLAVHRDQVRLTGTNFHAVIHAQPVHLTYLSHIPRYQSEAALTRSLLRWQPEAIVNLPEGVGYVPFLVPGSAELMEATTAALRAHRVVVWGKHGVMARSDQSVKRAADRIEYAETAARYESMNLSHGESAGGLTEDEIRAICRALKIRQELY